MENVLCRVSVVQFEKSKLKRAQFSCTLTVRGGGFLFFCAFGVFVDGRGHKEASAPLWE